MGPVCQCGHIWKHHDLPEAACGVCPCDCVAFHPAPAEPRSREQQDFDDVVFRYFAPIYVKKEAPAEPREHECICEPDGPSACKAHDDAPREPERAAEPDPVAKVIEQFEQTASDYGNQVEGIICWAVAEMLRELARTRAALVAAVERLERRP